MEIKNQAADLFRVMDHIRRAWQSVTPCDTLSKAQFSTLLVIARGGQLRGPFPRDYKRTPIKPTVLAQIMGQSLPALSQRIRFLEDLGYLERVPDPDDRRINAVRLSEEGILILKSAYKQFNDILSEAIVQIGAEKCQTLITLLSDLADALEQAAWKEPPEA